MKYSDGFFVFRTETSNENALFTNSSSITDVWMNNSDVEDFNTFTYYWMKRDKEGYKGHFFEAPIWLNKEKRILIIFLNDYKLISEVIPAASKKFEVNLIPFSLATRTELLTDGNLVITNKGISDKVNRVKTTLLKNDQQRVRVIESVLVGE